MVPTVVEWYGTWWQIGVEKLIFAVHSDGYGIIFAFETMANVKFFGEIKVKLCVANSCA